MRPIGRRRSLRAIGFEAIEPRFLLSVQSLDEPSPPYAAGTTVAPTTIFAGDPNDVTGLVRARAAYGLTGEGQTVAVIDSGIAYTHTDLGGGFGAGCHVVAGYDFAEGDANPYDDGPAGSHGTHVSSILAGIDPSYVGVAPNVDLVGLRVFDDSGAGRFVWVEQALQWVHQHRGDFAHPITVVNLSLGSLWNSGTPPDWATIEDDLATLESDGIFIAVAAGNSFTTYNQPGLAYPAASSHVVPVSSVDPDGTLSYFSQRHDRAIAAPGRSIESAVPDYLGDGNGIDDDYGRYSGTSMAAPFVAGAAALLREAYARVGVTGVAQATIYNLMCSTADTIYDPATCQNYLRLNLLHAADSILAGHTTTTPTDPQPTDPQPPQRPTTPTQPEPPQQPTTPTEPTALPAGEPIPAQGKWISLTAQHAGYLTVVARFQHSAGDVDMELYDAQGRLAGGSYSSTDLERIDVEATSGQTFRLYVYNSGSTANPSVSIQISNLVQEIDGTVLVRGTEGDDQFTFTPGATHHVSINGVDYQFDAGRVTSVQFVGRGGNDRATLQGTSGNETATLAPHAAAWSGTGFQVTVSAARYVEIHGNGGTDSAAFQDSSDDDNFRGTPGESILAGPGFENRARGFANVQAYAVNGGRDAADLYGSSAADTFLAQAGYGRLRGDGYSVRASSFELLRAHGDGQDTAWLYDGVGDDTLTVRPGWAAMTVGDASRQVLGFGSVYATADRGGTNVACLLDASGNAVDYRPGNSTASWLGFQLTLRGFDVAASTSSGSAIFHALYAAESSDEPAGPLSPLSFDAALAAWSSPLDSLRLAASGWTNELGAVDRILGTSPLWG